MAAVGEQDIRNACESGDIRRAGDLAVRLLGPVIAPHLRAVMNVEADAEDAFQDWALRMACSIKRFRWDCSLRSLAFRIAHSARVDVSRRRMKRVEPLPSNQSALGAEMWRRTARDLPTLLAARVRRLREHLDEEERAILLLYVDEKLEWAEVTAALSPDLAPTAKRREAARLRKVYERVKEKLRALAQEEGVFAEVEDKVAVLEEMHVERG